MNSLPDETEGRARHSVRAVRGCSHTERRARNDAPYLAADEAVPREREAFHVRLLGWLRALWFTRSRWQRYRVTPRTNLASFRRELLRSIHGELRRSGLNPPHASRGTTL